MTRAIFDERLAVKTQLFSRIVIKAGTDPLVLKGERDRLEKDVADFLASLTERGYQSATPGTVVSVQDIPPTTLEKYVEIGVRVVYESAAA